MRCELAVPYGLETQRPDVHVGVNVHRATNARRGP
jgi:hypothetical protein